MKEVTLAFAAAALTLSPDPRWREEAARHRREGSRQSVLRGNPPGLREVEQGERQLASTSASTPARRRPRTRPARRRSSRTCSARPTPPRSPFRRRTRQLIAQTIKTANPTIPIMTIDADLAKEDAALRKTYLGTDNYLMGFRARRVHQEGQAERRHDLHDRRQAGRRQHPAPRPGHARRADRPEGPRRR